MESLFPDADNLLLTANQKSVKLADFGLAREETVTEMMTAETGTYRWMAPEVCAFLLTQFDFGLLSPDISSIRSPAVRQYSSVKTEVMVTHQSCNCWETTETNIDGWERVFYIKSLFLFHFLPLVHHFVDFHQE